MEGDRWVPRSVCKRWSHAALADSILTALRALARNGRFPTFAETEPRDSGVLSGTGRANGGWRDDHSRGWRRDSYSI